MIGFAQVAERASIFSGGFSDKFPAIADFAMAEFIFGREQDLKGMVDFQQTGVLAEPADYGLAGDAPKTWPPPDSLSPFENATAGTQAKTFSGEVGIHSGEDSHWLSKRIGPGRSRHRKLNEA